MYWILFVQLKKKNIPYFNASWSLATLTGLHLPEPSFAPFCKSNIKTYLHYFTTQMLDQTLCHPLRIPLQLFLHLFFVYYNLFCLLQPLVV